jgi:hypothetical protein
MNLGRIRTFIQRGLRDLKKLMEAEGEIESHTYEEFFVILIKKYVEDRAFDEKEYLNLKKIIDLEW